MEIHFNPPQFYLPGLHVGLQHYLILAALLFVMGAFAVMTRRHAVAILLGLELMLNAANINLVAFNRYLQPAVVSGQIFALMVIALAACEAAVGLALILALYRNVGSVTPDEVDELKG
jgi:NADH:ubiquinone oxidoreductase subunit K